MKRKKTIQQNSDTDSLLAVEVAKNSGKIVKQLNSLFDAAVADGDVGAACAAAKTLIAAAKVQLDAMKHMAPQKKGVNASTQNQAGAAAQDSAGVAIGVNTGRNSAAEIAANLGLAEVAAKLRIHAS